MEHAAYFMVGAVAGFWLSVFLFSTLIYKISKGVPQLAQVKSDKDNVKDLVPPKWNN